MKWIILSAVDIRVFCSAKITVNLQSKSVLIRHKHKRAPNTMFRIWFMPKKHKNGTKYKREMHWMWFISMNKFIGWACVKSVVLRAASSFTLAGVANLKSTSLPIWQRIVSNYSLRTRTVLIWEFRRDPCGNRQNGSRFSKLQAKGYTCFGGQTRTI